MRAVRRLMMSGWEHWLLQIDAAGLRVYGEDSSLVAWAVDEADRA